MGSISNDITIRASPSDVYKYVADPHNAPHYISAIRRIESGPRGLSAQGQVWHAEAELFGKVRPINLRLAQLRPGKLVRYTISGDPPVEISIDIRPDGESKAEVEFTIESPSFPSILMNAVLGNILSGDLRRLKAILEDQST
jgi:hypothetical protein